MSHYDTSYKGLSPEEADEKALQDIRDYCGVKLWEVLLVEVGRVKENGTAEAFQQLQIACSFAGISGYPVHALGRKHCLQAYRAWMHDGDNAIMTDEKGHPIKKEGE